MRTAVHDELRWKRVVQNDIEAIPLALLLFLVSVSVRANANVNARAIVAFTVARVVHTVAYVGKRPLLRMLAWLFGVSSRAASMASSQSSTSRTTRTFDRVE